MHYHLRTIFAILVPVAVSALEIPADLEDGVYFAALLPSSAKLRLRGTSAYGPLEPVGPAINPVEQVKHKRDGPSYGSLERLSPVEPKKGAAQTKRGDLNDGMITDHTCSSQTILDLSDHIAVVNQFKGVCAAMGDAAIPAHEDKIGVLVAKHGGALFYGCSMTGKQPCPNEEIDFSVAWLNQNCGYLRSGNLYTQDWAKGYGRGDTGVHEICEHTLTGWE